MTSDHPALQPVQLQFTKLLIKTGPVSLHRSAATGERGVRARIAIQLNKPTHEHY